MRLVILSMLAAVEAAWLVFLASAAYWLSS
jgi:hypothetical protein